jgi:hypothetical protein
MEEIECFGASCSSCELQVDLFTKVGHAGNAIDKYLQLGSNKEGLWAPAPCTRIETDKDAQAMIACPRSRVPRPLLA